MGNEMGRERHLDFDTVVKRTDTDSLKFDFAVENSKPADILPLWVADMDFQTSSFVTDALTERVQHGIYGYTDCKDSYFEAVHQWMSERHHWEIKKEWIVKTPGVVFALAMAVKAFTEVGDAVLIQQPVYHPFSNVITNNDRRVVSSDLVLGESGKYEIDFDDFEKKIVDNDVRMFLLCSPHNPVSRVWTAEELRKIGEICVRHNVLVIADEIHEDFVFGEREHQVFANLDPAFEPISVTCTSPGKTFNLAGLQISNIMIPDAKLREKYRHQISAAGAGLINILGLVACEAAYRHGGEWYEAMMSYVAGNIAYMKEFLETELPELTMIETEGTYLVWVDFRKLGLSDEELEDLIVNKAKLWLDDGGMFGKTGKGFERFNVACPRATLAKAMEQLKKAIRG